MTRNDLMPLGMGALMGAAMLAMTHEMLIAPEGGAGVGALFVAAHLAVLVVVGGLLALGVGRGRLFRVLSRHRPGRRHLGLMFVAAIGTALLIHLVHGGPQWI